MAEKEPKVIEIPSNEEIMEELTKNVEESCTIGDSKSETDSNLAYEDALEDENFESTTEEKKRPDDYIDEEELKEKEDNYSEEDLERLKNECEEMKKEGNDLFKAEEYKEAALKYTLALRTCPLAFTKERAVLYANRGAAKLKMELTESAIEDCSKSIEIDPNYVRALLRRAQLYEKDEKLDEALEDYKKIIELDPNNREANIAVQRLPRQIHERNEKMKTEMLGKLKDLGNMFLKPFGLSTNNFNMVQDPNSGGYSISFKQS